jgi:hypothetical protein
LNKIRGPDIERQRIQRALFSECLELCVSDNSDQGPGFFMPFTGTVLKFRLSFIEFRGGSVSRVGKDIEANCTKCKMLLNHVVVSELNGVVSKVQCRTCVSLHKYRNNSEKPASVKKEKTARLVKVKSSAKGNAAVAELQRLWQMKKDALPHEADILDYRPDLEYEESDIVEHAKFGLGFVERIISSTRLEILFKDGLKLMAMNTHPGF